MTHAAIAVVVQVLFWLLTGSPIPGGIAGAAFYIGRELTQAEYRAIETLYAGKRQNAPAWCGLDPRAWDAKSVLDMVLPSACVSLVAALDALRTWAGW